MSEIDILKQIIQELKEENRELKEKLEIKEAKTNKKGRKNKFEAHDIESMKFYRFQGESYREIAKIFKCSTGLVHNLINEN